MSVNATLTQIKTQLLTVTPEAMPAGSAYTDQPGPRRAWTEPPEQVGAADFPCFVMRQLPAYTIGYDPNGYYTHTYTVEIWLFVGALGMTPLPELEARARCWEKPVAEKLTQDLVKLTGSVLTLANLTDTLQLTCRMGPIQYGEGDDYFGLSITMPCVERYTW